MLHFLLLSCLLEGCVYVAVAVLMAKRCGRALAVALVAVVIGMATDGNSVSQFSFAMCVGVTNRGLFTRLEHEYRWW